LDDQSRYDHVSLDAMLDNLQCAVASVNEMLLELGRRGLVFDMDSVEMVAEPAHETGGEFAYPILVVSAYRKLL
jgi:hypothetical protein